MKRLLIILSLISLVSLGIVNGQTGTGDCVNCNNAPDPGPFGDDTFRSRVGYNNIANGDYSFVGGEISLADGLRSFAFGYDMSSTGINSVGFGNNSTSSGAGSFAFGKSVSSESIGTFAMGSRVKARFAHAFAIGNGPTQGELVNNQMETMVIGFNSNNPTLFISRSINDAWPYDKTGRIGIGNMTAPSAKLHIYADDNEDATLFLQPSNWAGGYISKLMLGTENYWLKTENSNGMQFNSPDGYKMDVNNIQTILIDAGSFEVKGKTITETFRLFNPANPPQSGYVLQTDALGNGLWQEANFSKWDDLPGGAGIMYNNGHVGIGTTETYDYMLAVGGKIISEEVTVELQADWPDYVFADDYKLEKLSELKDFIDKNKRLPDVPSAEEVEANGIDLGKMNAVLLKKVEELTLYLIGQQEMIEKQQAQINELVEAVRK